MSKLEHSSTDRRLDARTGKFRELSPEESQAERVIINALGGTRNMIQYLIEPYANGKRIVVTGAAIDPAQDVTGAVRSALDAQGFNDWTVEMTIKSREQYFAQAS